MITTLFEQYDEHSPVIVSVRGVGAVIQENGMVALHAAILDPRTLKPSGKELIVQMLPVDADGFAAAVHEAAKADAWKFPSDAKFVKWQDDHSGESGA